MHALQTVWPQPQTRSFPFLLHTWTAFISSEVPHYRQPENLSERVPWPPACSCLAHLHPSFRSWFKGRLFIILSLSSQTASGPIRSFYESLVLMILFICHCVWMWSCDPHLSFPLTFGLCWDLLFYSLLNPWHFAQCQECKVYSVTNVLKDKCTDNDLLVAGGVQAEVEPPLYKCISVLMSDQSWLDDF